jgi:C_GCAxxG_C_C family probable redox protein
LDADQTGRRARKLFESGYYCAESVLMAVADAQKIETRIVPAVATGFCSGQARTCGQCGAVSGAVMSLGMLTGRHSPEETVDKTYEVVREFLEEFKRRFGSTNCEELLGCDLGTQEGQVKFQSEGLQESCFGYTEEAARIVMRLIERRSGG